MILLLIKIFLRVISEVNSTTETIHGCEVTKYEGILYTLNNTLGENRYIGNVTFNQCVEQCLMKPNCHGVTFVEPRALCSFHSTTIEKNEADISNYEHDHGARHAAINCKHRPSHPVGCGWPAYTPLQMKQRVIGGRESKPHSFPWLVRMTIDLLNGYFGTCGASLLRVSHSVEESDILLTAAHCVTNDDKEQRAIEPQKLSPSQITVVAGDHHKDEFDEGQITIDVDLIEFPDEFRFPEEGALNDIALVRLTSPIPFSDVIRPICIPVQGEAAPVHKHCVAAGWGRTDKTVKDSAHNLLQVVAPVQEESVCKAGWGAAFKEDIMLCAGSLQGDSGTCVGDSGGPLACVDSDSSWTIYGVTSFAVAGVCVEKGRPGIFTRVSNYIDWILKTMEKMTAVIDDRFVEHINTAPLVEQAVY